MWEYVLNSQNAFPLFIYLLRGIIISYSEKGWRLNFEQVILSFRLLLPRYWELKEGY